MVNIDNESVDKEKRKLSARDSRTYEIIYNCQTREVATFFGGKMTFDYCYAKGVTITPPGLRPLTIKYRYCHIIDHLISRGGISVTLEETREQKDNVTHAECGQKVTKIQAPTG